jgi:uncharacterized protein (TIGR00369 family)
VAEDAETRVRESFARQGLMAALGASLQTLAPGRAEVAVAPPGGIDQQHGLVSAIADAAAGYAAQSLMPVDREARTTEFKINFLAPAKGEKLIARARVVKSGSMLTLVQSEVFADKGGQERLVALLAATIMSVDADGEGAG